MSPIITALEVDRYAGRMPSVSEGARDARPRFYLAHVTVRTNVSNLDGRGALTLSGGVPGDQVFEALQSKVIGHSLQTIRKDMTGFTKGLKAATSQLPDVARGDEAMQRYAVSILLFAIWDLWAKCEEKPLWQVIAELEPEEVVDLIDFSNLTDALTENEALDLLKSGKQTRGGGCWAAAQKTQPACFSLHDGGSKTSNQELLDKCTQALDQGVTMVRLTLDEDLGVAVDRASLVRECVGASCDLVLNADAQWSSGTALANMSVFADFEPSWIEDPLSPSDFVGYQSLAETDLARCIAVGKTFDSALLHKQAIMTGICRKLQVDPRRLCGLAEGLAVLLLAAKYECPVTFHCGFGPLAYAHHLAYIDMTCLGGNNPRQIIELDADCNLYLYTTAFVKWGRFLAPMAPGMDPMIRGAQLQSIPTPRQSETGLWEILDWSASNTNFPDVS